MPKFIIDALTENTITLRTPGMNYQNTFLFQGNAAALHPGERVRGRILAPAWKIDRVDLGGNYVEPLLGRPRRMQGTILAVNPAANELTVRVGYEVTVRLPDRYRAADFTVGERVGWDNIDVPLFVLEATSTADAAAPTTATTM
jgi:hypothetical protein